MNKVMADQLESLGFDGLVDEDKQCNCKLDNLSPRNCYDDGCVPGYLLVHEQNPKIWIISPIKNERQVRESV